MNGMSSTFNSGSGGAAINEGDIIKEIQTQRFGFKTLQGDQKARVLPQTWPQDALPPPYASLLSIASGNGLYAAGGPDALVIGRTDDARSAIYDSQKGQTVRDCSPIHTIEHSRLAHVAFASDESCLVVAEEQSSEIVAYSTSDLRAGRTNVALRQSTQAPIRAIAPNPDPAQARYFALLNTDGQLLLADLGQAQLVSGANGPVLTEGVSCVAWSTKGKQLMAGKADGTAVQLKTDGSVVATVAKPSSVPANCHLAQIAWVESEVYLFAYTPSSVPEDINSLVSEYYIVKTNKARSEFNFHKFEFDPFYPQVPRAPAHFHISRLRNYAPHLEELLIIASTVSPELKTITKASGALSDEAEQSEYTITTIDIDQRLAATPMGEDGATDTTAIGMAIDLSDKDPIVQPLSSDPEYDNSVVPLPELVTLNNEGLLNIWAVVYDDGVKTKKPYPGFEEVVKISSTAGAADEGTMDAAPSPAAVHEPPRTTDSSAFTSSTSSPFQSATNITSMSSSSQPSSAFGAGGGFGKPAPISGETKSSWTSAGFGGGAQQQSSGFGQTPAFGATPALGSIGKPTFGQSPALGGATQQKPAAPAFGASGFGQKAGPAFGQTGFGAPAGQSSPFASAGKPAPAASPFASAGAPSSGGFGSFAGQGGGFGAVKKDEKAESPFGKFGTGSGFGGTKVSSPFGPAPSTVQSPFGQASSQSAFGKPSPLGGATSGPSPFGQAGKSGFKLESTFQKDETSKDDDDSKDSSAGFGLGGFGGMLGNNPSKPIQSPSKEESMEDENGSGTEIETTKKPQETPPSTITQPKTTTTPHVQSIFGHSTTPQTQPQQSLETGFSFGNFPSTTPKDTPAPSKTIFGTKAITENTPAAVAKSEPNRPFSFIPNASSQLSDSDRVKSLSDSDEEDEEEPANEPEAPLPPDPFSKPGYSAGDTSASSGDSKTSREPDDAPLPPDFVPANKSAAQSVKTQESEMPSEALSSDSDEGSGEDVTGDVSPVEERESEQGEETERVETSPESSFGRASDQQSPVESPTGGPFTKISKAEQPKSRPLFGEMGTSGPIFAPPKPKPQESPRSPSPLRKPSRQDMLSRSPERSFSAPAHPRSVIQQRKQEYQQSSFGAAAARAKDEEMERERARREAQRQAQEEALAAERQPLEDDEDAILQEELAKPTQPSENLDPFITIQPGKALQDLDKGRTDIPSQIEKLYQDINSMIITLGINAKSLSSYMMHQSGQEPNEDWPNVLSSDTPMDALNDEWYLKDIDTLPSGTQTLDGLVSGLEVKDVMQKLEDCQNLLTKEVTDLRGRITALRRSTAARTQSGDNTHAPLSAEQSSLQQDLRKASASVLTGLAQVEDDLVVLRAKLADLAPSKDSSNKQGMFGMMSAQQKRPSVEAVMNTVQKMTGMAEKRSADVDVLEVQMKKLGLDKPGYAAIEAPSTPERRVSRRGPQTPGSGASSVFYTPESRGSRSVRGTPCKDSGPVISVEDRQKWQAKAKRRKDVANALKNVLKEKHGKSKA